MCALVRLLELFGHLDVPEGDRRPVAHAAEYTAREPEKVRRCVEFRDLAGVEDADTVVSNDRAQTIYARRSVNKDGLERKGERDVRAMHRMVRSANSVAIVS